MTPMRPTALIAAELADAEAMAEATRDLSREDPLVADMLTSNDRDIDRLRSELAEARSSDLELSVQGRPVQDHRISSSYFARLLTDTQAAYRAAFEMVRDEKPTHDESTLLVASTSPGSFRVRFRTAQESLSLLEPPRSEQTIGLLFDLFEGTADFRRNWAERAAEKALRSMIRLAATLASSQGATQLRWTLATTSADRVTTVTADAARRIAADLAGAPGIEVVVIEGHLSRAQDDPPRVRVSPADGDGTTADVRDEDLLALVQEMLFTDVRATVAVQMVTSPSTGAPSTRNELLDLQPIDE